MEFAPGIWNPDPSDQAIEALCAQGVTAIEFGPPFLLQEDEAALASAAERYRAAGIRFYACHAPFDEPAELSQLEDEATPEGDRPPRSEPGAGGARRSSVHGHPPRTALRGSRDAAPAGVPVCQPGGAGPPGAGGRRPAGPGKHAARARGLPERRRAARRGSLSTRPISASAWTPGTRT